MLYKLRKITNFFFIAAVLAVCGCATQQNQQAEPAPLTTNKSKIRMLSSKGKEKPVVSDMRAQMLRDTALSLGARSGLAYRGDQINNALVSYEKYLYHTFNFQRLILDDNVLPPILVEARKTLNLASPDAIRIAEMNYQIIHQAKFVTSAPTWRDYLWLAYDPPEVPDKSLLPKNKAERIIWQKYIDEGWDAGIQQAETIYTENISRLIRDFNGMIKYRWLLMQNMVSPPYVATLDLGITGGGNEMSINDRVLRITAHPSLQAHGENWKTEITKLENRDN